MILATHLHLSLSDHAIASEARRRGWEVSQLSEGAWYGIPHHHPLRYYGNTPLRTFSRRRLPVTFHEIDPTILASIPHLTHRKVTLMSLFSLVQPLPARLFVKAVQGKWFPSRVYQVGEVVSGTPHQLGSDDPRDRLIYTSRPVPFAREVRTWCLDGQIRASSTYRALGAVDLAVLSPLVESLYRSAPALPSAVVADWGLRADTGEWSLVELNRPWAADVYRADPARCFDVVIASQSHPA